MDKEGESVWEEEYAEEEKKNPLSLSVPYSKTFLQSHLKIDGLCKPKN